ncbi:signal peptidase II [Nocardia thailandica]|uniref:Lipoprotein signal peptidase n=1 Tax=Nocardia farcinica (strain IFM 10152) TaxID=247156 RepID=Q5YMN2_NOCFA|nr:MULTISPECIES: signal peptidase II [Nocardia]BAD60559.1 putative signal peptidase [Nocardia farcinica IFM 10152]
MTATASSAPTVSRWGRRLRWAITAAVLAGLDLALKAWAQTALDGAPVEAGPVDLRLAFNPGAAFSIAADAPSWVMLSITTVITTGVAVGGWVLAPRASLLTRVALAAILGGAAANVIDRAPDGLVTDYLHTGWWPTFNLADSFIVLGAIALIITTLIGNSDEREQLSPDHHTDKRD